jgi:hypothetical protein
MLKKSLFLISAAGVCTLAQAAIVAQYDFNTAADPVDVNATGIPASTTGADVTASAITGAGGLEIYRIRNPNSEYDSNVLLTANDDQGSVTADSFTNNGFFSFTVTPDVGFELNLASLDFLVALGGNSETRNYEIRSNLTGATSLAGPAAPTGVRTDGTAGMDNISIDLTGFTEFQNLTTPVTFQFITATTGNFNATLEWDNITVSAVPEPSTYAALFGLGALGLVMWRRRRRS